MATSFKNSAQEIQENTHKILKTQNPNWYSPLTGIYTSKHPQIDLPSDPFIDTVTFLFSHKHNGVAAFIDSSSGYSISYSQLYPFVKSVASGLHQMGVKQGDVVLIALPNSIYLPIILLGILYIGAVVTPMNPLASFQEIKKQTLDCNVKFAFVLPNNVDKISAFGTSVISVPERLNLDAKTSGDFDFYKLICSDPNLVQRPVIRQLDTAAIMYSSGTTGTGKGVMLTHKNFIAMIELFVRFEASQYKMRSSENVYLAVLPMFHIYGLSLFVMGLLSLGTSIVVMRKFNVEEVTMAIHRYGVTHFPVVPPLLAALTRIANTVDRSKLKSLKQVSCGAASLSQKIIEDFIQAFPHVDFIQGYGLTESTAVGARGFNTKNLHNYSSVGLLAPNMEAKVVDFVSGVMKGPGSMGELWLRGPAIMPEYLNNMEATKSTIDEDGWLHTGDISYFDQKGYMHIVDRAKEIIKYKGFQIAPAELEAILVSSPGVLDAAVTASSIVNLAETRRAYDEEAGEIPVAFVVRKHGSEISQAALIDYVAKQVAPYKKVRKVVFTDSIPRSAAGKILRRELRKYLTSKI